MELCFLVLLVALSCLVLPLLFLKFYVIFTTRWNRSPVCLVGKTAIVTGSNIGIGYYTALDFAKRGARVILACRNANKAEAAKNKIIEDTGNSNVIVKIVDLSSLNSVRQFAKDINETEPRLDILDNNAGGGGFEHCYTDDGLSLMMQTNHFGPFLLTLLLIGLLKKSKSSRIVTVSSYTASLGNLDIENLNAPSSKAFATVFDYGNTKLCNLLFTIKLAHELRGSGVTANTLHPGVVKSDFLKDFPSVFAKILGLVMKLTFMSTEAGAQTSVYVATAKELTGISGKFFADCAETAYPASTHNNILANMLWDKSKELVKLTKEEERALVDA